MITRDQLFPILQENFQYKGFDLVLFVESDFDIAWMQYTCIARNKGRIEQVRDPNGILQVIRHNPDEIKFTISGKDIICNESYNNPALAIIDVFHYKVDEFLKAQEQAVEPERRGIKTYRCDCCGTEYTTDKLGYTPTCKNCGALMKELEKVSV